MKNFDGYNQKFDDNTRLIEPMSTFILAIQTSLEYCKSQLKGINNLWINDRFKALKQPIDDIQE